MDKRSLTRLRIAFLLLGAALLLPLGLLLRSVDARLEAQRRLRHELVAERIFDEMEGELSALLAREAARPSAAYSDTSTRVENWAPFVVGYFKRSASGLQIVARPQLASARVRRLEAALKPAAESGDKASGAGTDSAAHELLPSPAAQSIPFSDDARSPEAREAAPASAQAPTRNTVEQERKADEYDVKRRAAMGASKGLGAGIEPAMQKVQPAPEAVLKQLNRAADIREREAPRAKRKASREDNDPLSGLE